MQTGDFDYSLPKGLIAQYPADKRDTSRLMIVNRNTDEIADRYFYDVSDYLNPGDCLVLNNSKVFPARLVGRKVETGGRVEFLLQRCKGEDIWEAMVKPGKRVKPGDRIFFSADPFLQAKVLRTADNANRIIKFEYEGGFMDTLNQIGQIPLPPYIKRENEDLDRERYQTVYCKDAGSTAAPTAGLHFTANLLKKLAEKGVNLAYITLHIGIGTFRPVKSKNIEDHLMHSENYEIDEQNAKIINDTRLAKRRVIAVGTTSVRTLESVADFDGRVRAGAGSTDIFIYPGYNFKAIDCLLTNFHLPESTLLMLVSAFYDRKKILDAYERAVKMEYRFFSYGDAMLII